MSISPKEGGEGAFSPKNNKSTLQKRRKKRLIAELDQSSRLLFTCSETDHDKIIAMFEEEIENNRQDLELLIATIAQSDDPNYVKILADRYARIRWRGEELLAASEKYRRAAAKLAVLEAEENGLCHTKSEGGEEYD